MVDNVRLSAGTDDGAIMATDEAAGSVHHPYTKLEFGADNTQTKVTSSAGLPVTPDSGGFEVNAVQSGTWTVDLGSNNDVVNAGTFVVQEDGAALTALQLIDDAVHADDAAFTLGTSKGVMMMGFAGTQSVNANDAGAIAMEVDGSVHIHDGGNSITVDAASLPLPTGAATETTLGAVKTAVEGTIAVSNAGLTELAAAINVSSQMDVNLAASSATVTVDGSGVTQPVSGSVTANLGTIADVATATLQATVNTNTGNIDTNTTNLPNVIGTDGAAGPTSSLSVAGTESGGNLQELRVDADGHLQVDILSGTVTTVSTVTNLAQLGGTAVSMNTGVRDAGTQRVTIATNDSVPVTGTLTANPASGTIDTVTNLAQMGGVAITRGNGASGTGVQRVTIASDSTGQVKLAAGTAGIGKLTANSGVDIGDVDVTSISAGTNVIGDVGISGARTSGGTTFYKNLDVDESEDAVKATAGQIYWIHAINLTAAPLYLKFYDATVATVVVGTDVPDLTFPVPGNADSDGSAGSVIWTFPAPANSGATHSFSLPLKGAANTALAYDVSAAITTMYVSVNGFQAQG